MSIEKSKTMYGKIRSGMSFLAVEPVIFLTLLASMIYQAVTQNLYLEKACRVSLNFNETICDAISRRDPTGYTPFDEAEIQKFSSKMLFIKSIIQGLFPSCVSLFAGSWSDRHNKRKIVILLPVFGELVGCVFLILNVIFFYELPIEFTALSDALPMSIMGGWPCLLLGIYSFVAAVKNEENRTVRIGILATIQSISILLGMGGSGVLYEVFGFIASYGLCVIMILIALVYGYLSINDIPMSREQNERESEPKRGFVRDFFDLRNIVATFRVCFGSKENNKKYRMSATMIIAFVAFGTMYGENSVSYMYTRYRYGWNAVDYSAFMAFQFIMHISSNIFSLGILSQRLHWQDSTLGMISMMTSVVGGFIFAFAPSTVIFYLGAVIGGVPPYFAMKSLVGKLVPFHEQGQVNAILGLSEALSSFVCMSLYTIMYKYTIDFFPGTFYLTSTAFRVMGFCAFGYLYKEVSKDMKLAQTNEKNSII